MSGIEADQETPAVQNQDAVELAPKVVENSTVGETAEFAEPLKAEALGADQMEVKDNEKELLVQEKAPPVDDTLGGNKEDENEAEIGEQPPEAEAGDKEEDAAVNDVAVDEDEDQDIYVAGTSISAAKIPKFKKRRDLGNRDDEDIDNDDDVDDDDREVDEMDEAHAERRRRKRQRKANRRQREARSDDEHEDGVARAAVLEEEDGEAQVMDERAARAKYISDMVDNAGKKTKVMRRKKKGGDDVDIVDTYHDEVCARLRDRMIAAADKDEAARRDGKPATTKLAMLDEVVSVLRNTTLFTSIVDNGVLEAVRRWLEPLPDRSLPAVGIQNAIFEILPKMDFDTTTLKECRLGPIILFYTKTKRVTPTISRAADALVQTWSRPIIKRPADFRSKYVQRDDEGEQGGISGNVSDGEDVDVDIDVDGDGDGDNDEKMVAKKMKAATGGARVKRFDVQAALRENVDRRGARVPQIKDVQYTVAPASRTQHRADDLEHVSRIQLDNRKFNRFARQLKIGRK